MKRRTFLKTMAPVASLPFLINGLPITASAKGSFFESVLQKSSQPGRVLVLIQLIGGNDGLNTVIPLDQYDNLLKARSNIMIPEGKVLPLYDSTITGFHPAMTGLQKLYNSKLVSVVQGVIYPNPDYSHFKSTDIWLMGSDARTVLTSGWVGRYLAQKYPDYPAGYPNAITPDPLAIQIGSVVSTALQGPTVSMGYALTSTSDFYDIVTGPSDSTTATPAGEELAFIRQTSVETQQYTASLRAAAKAKQNLSALYPAAGSNPLADQLKMVAQLVGGGLQTKVYMVSLNGFDTHNAQVNASDTTTGVQAELLKQLSDAIAAFEDDLHLMDIQDNVVGLVFSEFGRRIISNNSFGTDHGSAEPIMMFGSQLKGGLVGTNPHIPASVGVDDNLPMQIDYRAVYASVLKGWFGVTDAELGHIGLSGFPLLDLFKNKN